MARPYEQAAEFLRRVLENGPIGSQQAWEQAHQAGYSKRTYMRARKFLRVTAKRKGWGEMGRWQLSLPPVKIRLFPSQPGLEQPVIITPLDHASWRAGDHDQSRIRA